MTPEVVPWDGEGEEKSSATDYSRGAADLQLTFEHPVDSVYIKDSTALKEFESAYYTLENGDKTINIRASVLNGWGDGNYAFTFRFADGAEDKEVLVSVSGTYTPPDDKKDDTKPADPTPTPAPTATAAPTPTPTPAPKKGFTPNTGDNSPILLLAIILVILAAALVVVIVLVVRKNKRAKAEAAVVNREEEIPENKEDTPNDL